jgi:hypothetical protein
VRAVARAGASEVDVIAPSHMRAAGLRPQSFAARPVTRFSYCPLRAEFIDNVEEARAYYAYKLEGDRSIEVRGTTLIVRFNREEIHLFTEAIREGATPPQDRLVFREGSSEVRVFSRQRARTLDRILPTIREPICALTAKIHRGIQLIGPADAHGLRISVVVAPGSEDRVFFVRTMFPLTPTDFARARRGRPRPWPPK